MRSAKVVGALLPLVLLSACGGGTDVKPSDGSSAKVADQSAGTTDTPTSGDNSNLPSHDTLDKYFNGIATATLDSLKEAKEAAQPGSPAYAYAAYLEGYDQAYVDGGGSDDVNSEATKVDGGYKQCEGSGSDEVCYEYKNLEGSSGKLSNFTVNGKPLDDRLTVGNGKPIVANSGSSGTFIAAFEGSSGSNLYIVVSVKAGSKGVGLVQAKYLAPSGRQSESSDNEGPSDLDPGALANFAFTFPSAKIGGTLTLTISDSDYNDSTIKIKTR